MHCYDSCRFNSIDTCEEGVGSGGKEGTHEGRGTGELFVLVRSFSSRIPSLPFPFRHLPRWPRIIAENHYDIYNVSGHGQG